MSAMEVVKQNVRKTREWLTKQGNNTEDPMLLDNIAGQLELLGDCTAAAKYANKANAIRIRRQQEREEM